MNRFAAILLLTLISCLGAMPALAQMPSAPAKITLPPNIKWETNDSDPLIGSPKAIRGGTLRSTIGSYPLTFRLMGPNATDYFAGWNRLSTLTFGLVEMHPVTDHFIPMLATAWSIQPDNKTIYFKLDPDARWSDGVKITADDFVFAWKMLASPFIQDPFYNVWVKQNIQSVDKIDNYTLRIVGARPSWRPLYDYGIFFPMPAHAIKLDKDWVTRTNNDWQVVSGPYVITKVVRGDSVTFSRVKNWWGDNKRYFQGRFNFDAINLKVVPPDRELDYFRLGQIDLTIEGSPRAWREDYNFPAVSNGWVRRARIFLDSPTGINGLHMNLQAPIFQNKNFRIAMEYLYNFDRLNRNLLYGDYYRMNSFFEGTPFANSDVKSYPFDPKKAEEYLAKAGYHRPSTMHATGFWGRLLNIVRGILFTRTDTDDILVNDKGEKASFTVTYGFKTQEQGLTIVQQDYRKAGVDMRLQLLETSTAAARTQERNFEMMRLGMTTNFYPDPRQYLGTEFKKTINNNNFWAFGTPEVDSLIKTFEEDLDESKRVAAMRRIDQIVHDEAFYIPGSVAPYIRVAYWDYIQWPDFYLPKRAGLLTGDPTVDYMVYWIDPQKQAALQDAMKKGTKYPLDPVMDRDYYNVRARFK